MILVTGASGLLGVHLLMELSKDVSNNIKAIYRNEAKKNEAKKVFTDYNPYPNAEEKWKKITWVKADIIDIPSLQLAFENVSEIYHCAGFINFNTCQFNLLKKTNIEGTANMVNLALSHKVSKFCYVSSIATLNLNTGESSFNENSNWNPENDNSGYSISKFGGEMEVWRGIQEGLNAVIVNPGVIIGSGFFNKETNKLFSTVKKGIPFFTPGGSGYVSVKDCVLIMKSLMDQKIFNERFILVEKNMTHKSVIDLISSHLNVSSPKKTINKKWVSLFAKAQYLAYKIFGIEPSIPLEIVPSLFEISVYDNAKIKEKLNWSFEDINTTLKRVSLNYQSSLDSSSSKSSF